MAIEEYGGVVWTSSHFSQVDVFEHVVEDADVHSIYSYLQLSPLFFNLPIMVSILAEKIMSKKSPFVVLELVQPSSYMF
jgi:hypothetical protein